MSIQLRHALKKGDFELHVDTRIPEVGSSGLFGASGSGKTTLLRCIAGLELGGDATPVHARGIGYVVQQACLFPHLTVRDNIEYGARRSRRRTVDIGNVVELLDLGDLLHRQTGGLSGGEAQRVAIARALCQSPRLVLMDEPLSAVDAARSARLLDYIDRVRAELDIPLIYVSHSIDEICRLCDHLVVLDGGRVVASDTLPAVLSRIDLPQLGGGDTGVVIDAEQQSYDSGYDLTCLRFSGGQLHVPGRAPDGRVRVRIRANDVSLALERPASTSILNVLSATIDEIADDAAANRGATALVRVRLGDEYLTARVTRKSVADLGLATGHPVYIQIKSVTVRR